MTYLIDEYGYRGACLILGGVLMNGVVCAALMRPFPGTTISGSERKNFVAGNANDFNDIALTATSGSPSLSAQIRATSCDGVQGQGAISDDILAMRSRSDDIASHSLENGTRRKSLQKNSRELVLRVAETRTKATANGQFDTDPAVNCPVGDHAYARATEATSDVIGSRVQWLPNAFKQFVMMKQGANTKRYSITDVFGIKFFKDPVFVLFSTFGMFYGVGNDFLFLFYPAVTQDLGFSYYDSAFLLSAMGVCGIVGRLLLGVVGECVPQRYLVVVVAQTIQGIAILLCRYAVTFWSQLIFAITIGLVYGVPYAYKAPLLLDFFGDADMAKRIGVTSFVSGITSIIDPPLVGWLRDSTGDYSTSTYCSAALILSNGPILLTMRLLKRLDRRKKQSYDMDSRT